jgi:hypothetical protein
MDQYKNNKIQEVPKSHIKQPSPFKTKLHTYRAKLNESSKSIDKKSTVKNRLLIQNSSQIGRDNSERKSQKTRQLLKSEDFDVPTCSSREGISLP